MQGTLAGNLFSRSWQLLNRNWAIVVPGLIVALVAGTSTALFLPTFVTTTDTNVTIVRHGGPFGPILTSLVVLLAQIITISYTTGMAAAAWKRGVATFADGAAAFSREGGKVLTALIAFIVTFVLAAILAPFTLGLSLLAFFLLFLYTMASAVVGDHGGFSALQESYRVATRRFGATALIVVMQVVVFFAAGVIAIIFRAIPIVGTLVAQLIEQAFAAYFTLVIVGQYLATRDSTGDAIAQP